jgi:hypothetical protein
VSQAATLDTFLDNLGGLEHRKYGFTPTRLTPLLGPPIVLCLPQICYIAHRLRCPPLYTYQ